MRRFVFLLCSIACAGLAAAQSYRPDFDPATFKGPAAGPTNDVMVLGTPHLRSLKNFEPSMIDALNERLAGWQPQAIAIEELSGMQCDWLRRFPQQYQDTVKTYCMDVAPARAATGLDVPEATQQWGRQLATWPAAPTPVQRRHLAALFLAGGEKASALVQWLRLAPAERHAGDGLDAALVTYLQTLESRRDETTLISARLAARLGLERLYAMDDHSADSTSPAEVADEKAYGAAIMKAWDNPASKRRKAASDVLIGQLHAPSDLLALYRAFNAPGQGELIFAGDFGAAMNEPSPQRFGRGYLGYWETRNLRMAANIRTVLGFTPGIRMLVVVGASHKGYLEAYLHQMHDVRLIDTAPFLK
jgi:hypothetical protein